MLAAGLALLSPVWTAALAQHVSCTLVDSADLKLLLGRRIAANENPVGDDCRWGAVGIGQIGLTISLSPPDTAGVHDAFARGRELAGNNEPVVDEGGLGERAFSAVVAYGTTVTVLVAGRIIQLRYSDRLPGSRADLDRLRPIVVKIVSRLGGTTSPAAAHDSAAR